jgi:hypothetical protein
MAERPDIHYPAHAPKDVGRDTHTIQWFRDMTDRVEMAPSVMRPRRSSQGKDQGHDTDMAVRTLGRAA